MGKTNEERAEKLAQQIEKRYWAMSVGESGFTKEAVLNDIQSVIDKAEKRGAKKQRKLEYTYVCGNYAPPFNAERVKELISRLRTFEWRSGWHGQRDETYDMRIHGQAGNQCVKQIYEELGINEP